MSKPASAPSTSAPLPVEPIRPRAAPAVEIGAGLPEVVARSLYRTLKDKGFTPQQIVSVSSELIGLVTHELSPGSSDLKS
jgi:hypothetical protein